MPQAMLSPSRGRVDIPLEIMDELKERVDEVSLDEPDQQVATIDSFAK